MTATPTEDETCAICLETMSAHDICKLPCRHRFHSMCVIKSYMHNQSCPVCRGSQMESDETRHTYQPSVILSVSVPANHRENGDMRIYRQRIRELQRTDERARKHKEDMIRSRQRMNGAYDDVNELILKHNSDFRERLKRDSELIDGKIKLSKARNSFNRYRRIHERYIRETVGEVPESHETPASSYSLFLAPRESLEGVV